MFTCILNTTLNSSDVQWYRFIKSTGTIVMVNRHRQSINYNTIGNSSSLTITNARTSYTGYFWIGAPHFNTCIASLTVTPSM